MQTIEEGSCRWALLGRAHPHADRPAANQSYRRLGLGSLRVLAAMLALLVGAVTFAVEAPGAIGAEFTIDSDGDGLDADPGDPRCRTSSGACTLRAAIMQANADPARDTITVAGPRAVFLDTWLPRITQPVRLDALTDTGPGLTILAPPALGNPLSACTVLELVPNGRALGVGLAVDQAPGTVITGVRLGMFPCNGIFAKGTQNFELSASEVGFVASGAVATPGAWPEAILAQSRGVFLDTVPDAFVHHNVVAGWRAAAIAVQERNPRPPGSSPASPNRAAPDVRVEANLVNRSASGAPLPPALGARSTFGITVLGSPIAEVSNVFVRFNRIAALDTAIAVGRVTGRNTIFGNQIGPSEQLSDDAGAVDTGIRIRGSTRNLIRGNVIAGAVGTAIRLDGGAFLNEVTANVLGRRGEGIVPNGTGILVVEGARDNVIGYGRNATDPILACGVPTSDCNEITGGRDAGVAIPDDRTIPDPLTGGFLSAAGPGNTVRGNSIYLNGGMGIDAGARGVGTVAASSFANVHRLADTWPDPPVAVTAQIRGVDARGAPDITVSGILPDRRAPDVGSNVVVDVYRLEGADLTGPGVMRPGATFDASLGRWTIPSPGAAIGGSPSPAVAATTYGEGRRWMTSAAEIAPDGRFRAVLPLGLPANDPGVYTVTVTDPSGSTSEFSSFCVDADRFPGPDADGDGLCDEWETLGLDVDGDGLVDENLPKAGTRADHKDVLVEIDSMAFTNANLRPQAGGLTAAGAPVNSTRPYGLKAVEQAFLDAPVPNPDGTIGVHLILDPPTYPREIPVPFALTTQPASNFPPGSSRLSEIKDGSRANPCDGFFGTVEVRRSTPDAGRSGCAAMLAARAATYRWALFANSLSDPGTPNTSSGITPEYGGPDLLVTLGRWQGNSIATSGGAGIYCGPRLVGGVWILPADPADCMAEVQAGVFMHELGHAFGLTHDGGDHDDGVRNYRPNHLSVMSYLYMLRDLSVDRPLDYLRWDLTLDEGVPPRREADGIDPPAGVARPDANSLWPSAVAWYGDRTTSPGVVSCSVRPLPAPGSVPFDPIDWNGDGDTNDDLDSNQRFLSPDGSGAGPCAARPRAARHAVRTEWPRLDYTFRDGQPDDPEFRPPSPETGVTEAEVLSASAGLDHDGDGLVDADDNCPFVANHNQADADGDGVGRACDRSEHRDLVVTVSADQLWVDPDEVNAYTIEVTNEGTAQADDVIVQVGTAGLQAPTFLTQTGAYEDGAWAVGALPRGETASLVISARPDEFEHSVWAGVAGPQDPDDPDAIPSSDALTVLESPGDVDGPGSGSETGHLLCSPPADGSGFDGLSSCLWFGPPDVPASPTLAVHAVEPTFQPGAGVPISFDVSVDPTGGDPVGGGVLAGARASVPVPEGTAFVSADLVAPPPESAGSWSYRPATGLWRLPLATRTPITLRLTVRPAPSTISPIRLEGRLLSWQGHPAPGDPATAAVDPADASP